MPQNQLPFVPVVAGGLEGLSSCCKAPVTYHDSTPCRKKCWAEVRRVRLNSPELSAAIADWIRGRIRIKELERVQDRILASLS